ncbi:rhamnogalacturonidase [Hymenobacter properus]|uniref:Glycoside hydrolase family 28 protein n=1 Tax=Hymenobacter properus TaxID=2791026 RepID=A0A931BCZ6_9BACT|nr:glycoside hydrolase family 28 protein [Hymenobacter properus]MBF9141034.1 glycoside hydrolase family 28 protein [Hymenobacter properus]MBR7719843.1 glycoside hydrolase family 28 protein [Microvirga sp. SRT04]
MLQRAVLLLLLLLGGLRNASAAPPAGGFNIRDFGARGDSATLDTDAINRAIAAAAKAGGGTVYFPAGTYRSYSIRLQSHISLYLDQGAVLLAAAPVGTTGYDAPEPADNDKFQDFGHSHWHNSLIWGEKLMDISILGPGTIYGQGLTREGPHQAPVGNKAIALKLCRNVMLKDFTVRQGGHFALLATGVDNLTIDNLKLDTNRDGLDIDGCQNVRISNCTVNSPWDDAICLKSSFALGYARLTENVTITNCQVSGFDRGSLLDGTYRRNEAALVPDHEGPTGRIKFGTESNGGFRNIAISNCVFTYCRGLALETVDGGLLEDVTISNITMRDVTNSPIFLRLSSRLRAPAGTATGQLRRINISNVTVYNADARFATLLSGVPGHPIEDVRLSNISIWYRPLDAASAAAIQKDLPEDEKGYPEPQKLGVGPAYGFYIRHAKNIELSNMNIYLLGAEMRPALMLTDVEGARLQNVMADKAGAAPLLVLRGVRGLEVANSEALKKSTSTK